MIINVSYVFLCNLFLIVQIIQKLEIQFQWLQPLNGTYLKNWNILEETFASSRRGILFKMPTCCVPNCTSGYKKHSTGEKISMFHNNCLALATPKTSTCLSCQIVVYKNRQREKRQKIIRKSNSEKKFKNAHLFQTISRRSNRLSAKVL